MPGKSLNEWNCSLEGDFSLADELTGKQSHEALQNQSGKRKTEGQRIKVLKKSLSMLRNQTTEYETRMTPR